MTTILEQMTADRRHLHTIPEEGWTEFETTWHIAKQLKSIGWEKILFGPEIMNRSALLGRSEEVVARGAKRAVAAGVPQNFIDEIDELTGCAVVLETGRPGPVTACRFDIDCVCIAETNDPEHLPNKLGFASTHPGFMHACGHDGHTAVGLGVARWVFEHRDSLSGTIKLIFQPAEEGARGATAIAESGFLDDVDLILGSHVGGPTKLGEVGMLHDGMLASTKYDIRFTGQASHAGNAPEKGRSALMAACAASMMMAGIPRHGEGASRVSVGRLIAGEGRNVTPVHAQIQAEVRGVTASVNDFMCENVERIIEGCARAYDVKAEVERVGNATTLIDCPEVFNVLREAAKSVPGVKRIVELREPAASEDYTIMLRRVVEKGGRGAMFMWGCNHQGHHLSNFDIQDEESMPIGYGVFTEFLDRTNGSKR